MLQEAAGEIEQRVAHPGVAPVEQHQAVRTVTPVGRMEVSADECFGQAAGGERFKPARKIRDEAIEYRQFCRAEERPDLRPAEERAESAGRETAR